MKKLQSCQKNIRLQKRITKQQINSIVNVERVMFNIKQNFKNHYTRMNTIQ